MNTRRWEWVKDLLHQAMQLPSADRSVFLDGACASDFALRAELESLVAASDEVRSSFMQSPPLAEELFATAAVALAPGQIFAQRFLLIRKLGEGGMGQVWLAEQISPVKRQVALKLIKAGMYDASVIHRFQSERQSLAIMDHPAIAKVFDAGATEQGQPYFVMEYVPGLPITDYCDQKRLDIKQRLELFIQACEGVQHAHQKAIIHRDLKPANILVVEIDGKPVPRIIDFGLAKAASPRVGDETLLTQIGNFVGTPAYMSPEQADPAGQDIDTRTDVYSLGVVLYVLLTGVLPLDMKHWKNQALEEVLRQLREEEPQRPSTKVSADREASSTTAQARGTEPGQLVSLLRGDLDWITMKALEKDRARRYGTPSELASDIRHYLSHEPVAARPASAGYRIRKYVRRHQAGVSVAAALSLLLAGFLAVQAVQLRRITRERDRANRVTDFMVDMFKVSDPSQARGNTITAREVLDKASNDIDNSLTKDPELQAQMMYVMGRVYDDLGLYPKAESLISRAVEIRLRTLGPKNADTLDAESQLGFSLFREQRYGDAEKLLRQVLDESRRDLGETHRITTKAMTYMGMTLVGEHKLPEAETLAREALAIDTRTLGPDDPNTVQAMDELADVFRKEGHLPEAEKLLRQTLDIHRRIRGTDHLETQSSLHNLGNVLVEEERPAEAERYYREALDIDRRLLGPDHLDTAIMMNDLANSLSDQGRYAESEKLNRQALEIRRRALGPDDAVTAASKYNLACLAALTGKKDEALSLLSDAVNHGLSTDLDLGMDRDSDLKSLYTDARFKKIVTEARQHATTSRSQ